MTPGPWTPLRTHSMDYLTDWSTDPFYEHPHPPFLRTTQKNSRNVKVCEIEDSDEVSWIPGTMPYDPLDTIRLIQQRFDFLLDYFRTFKLNLNDIAIDVRRKEGNTRTKE